MILGATKPPVETPTLKSAAKGQTCSSLLAIKRFIELCQTKQKSTATELTTRRPVQFAMNVCGMQYS